MALTVDFTSLRTCVSMMRVRKHEACSESCGNNLITRTLTHHACSKQSEINSTTGYSDIPSVWFGKLLQLPVVTQLLHVPTHIWASANKKFTDHVTSFLVSYCWHLQYCRGSLKTSSTMDCMVVVTIKSTLWFVLGVVPGHLTLELYLVQRSGMW